MKSVTVGAHTFNLGDEVKFPTHDAAFPDGTDEGMRRVMASLADDGELPYVQSITADGREICLVAGEGCALMVRTDELAAAQDQDAL